MKKLLALIARARLILIAEERANKPANLNPGESQCQTGPQTLHA